MKKILYYHRPDVLAMFIVFPVLIFIYLSSGSIHHNPIGVFLCVFEGLIFFVIYTLLKEEDLFNSIRADVHFERVSKVNMHDTRDIQLSHLQHWHRLGTDTGIIEIQERFACLIAEHNDSL